MLIFSVDILSFLVSLIRSLSVATRDPLPSFHCSIVPSLPLSLCPRIIFTGEVGGATKEQPSQQAPHRMAAAAAAATTATAATTTTAMTSSGLPSHNLPRGETEVRRWFVRYASREEGGRYWKVSTSQNFDIMNMNNRLSYPSLL